MITRGVGSMANRRVASWMNRQLPITNVMLNDNDYAHSAMSVRHLRCSHIRNIRVPYPGSIENSGNIVR